MKLSQQLLCKAIARRYEAKSPENPENTLNLGRPYLYSETSAPHKNRVLLCSGIPLDYLSRTIDSSSFILYIPSEAPSPKSNSINVLELSSSVNIHELFNYIQEIFDMFDEWDETLQELMRSGESPAAFLDASFSLFGNPLLLRASDFSLLAYNSAIEEMPELSHLTDPNINFENLTTCKLDPLYSQAQEYRKPFFLPEYLSGSRELCVNLFEHQIFSYRLILEEELQEIDVSCTPLLEHLAQYISHSLALTGPGSMHTGHTLEQLLQEVIRGNITDFSILDNKFSDFGWSSTHDYCCMRLQTASLDKQNLTANYICHYLEEIITGACAFQCDEDIVVFVNLTRYGHDADKLIFSCIEFIRDSFLKAGISNTFRGNYDLYYCSMQSRIALDVGTRRQPYRWIHRYEDLSMTWLLECCTRDMPTHIACSPKIRILKSYDVKHKSDYCLTLQVYLNNHLNAVAAARELFIHRSTFLYRLERIKELAGIDFEDEEMLFYLELSFRILQLEKAVSMDTIERHQN